METWTQQDEAGNTLNLPGVSAWALLRRQVQTSQQVWPGPSEQVATRYDTTAMPVAVEAITSGSSTWAVSGRLFGWFLAQL